ncbi:MAG: hypothetical protein EOO24_35990, partial [Comamonadaceae bacterium]
ATGTASPTEFTLSVHNAISAMYAIARGDTANSTSIAAGAAMLVELAVSPRAMAYMALMALCTDSVNSVGDAVPVAAKPWSKARQRPASPWPDANTTGVLAAGA